MRKQEEITGITPLALRNRPDLSDTSLRYFYAFNTLDKTRTSGGPITLSEIEVYARMIDEDPLYLAEIIVYVDYKLLEIKQSVEEGLG